GPVRAPQAMAVAQTSARATVPASFKEHTGVEDGGGIEDALGALQCGSEQRRPLAVVVRPVIAADGVVMGDGTARSDDALRDGGLDLVPLGEMAAGARRREHRDVGR